MLAHSAARLAFGQKERGCNDARPSAHLVEWFGGADRRLVKVARGAGEMVEYLGPVDEVGAGQQIGRGAGHVEEAPGAVINAPSRDARPIAIGRQPFFGNRRSKRCALAAIDRNREVAQPIETVDIFDKGRRQRQFLIINGIDRLLHALEHELADADGGPARLIPRKRVGWCSEQLHRQFAGDAHLVQRRAPAQLIEHQRNAGGKIFKAARRTHHKRICACFFVRAVRFGHYPLRAAILAA